MKAKQERYEFIYDGLDQHSHEGVAFDVCTEKQEGMPRADMAIVVMSGDQGEGKGHDVFGAIEFCDESNLALAQMGLEIFQDAVMRDKELAEELAKECKDAIDKKKGE